MNIGALASSAKCSTETVRFYEREGLLPEAPRTGGNYRSYGSLHVERLRFIRNCRALDMSHEEIRTLLTVIDAPAEDCGAINDVLDQHIQHVGMRIEELSQLRSQLCDFRRECASEQPLDTCGILRSLTTMETEPRSGRHTHLG